MKAASHILLWLSTLFVLMVVVPAFMPPEHATQRIDREHRSALDIFGESQTASITSRANAIHQVLFIDSGMQAAVEARYTTEKQLQEQELAVAQQRDIASAFNRYLFTFSTQVYGVFFRGNIMLQWAFYLAAFLVAVVVDGMAQRKVKVDSGGAFSPVKFALSVHTMIAIVFAPLLYMILPFHVTPWFMPVWAIVIAVPLSKAISNAPGME